MSSGSTTGSYFFNNAKQNRISINLQTDGIVVSKNAAVQASSKLEELPYSDILGVNVVTLSHAESNGTGDPPKAVKDKAATLELFVYSKVKSFIGSKMNRKRVLKKLSYDGGETLEDNVAHITELSQNIKSKLRQQTDRFQKPLLFLLNPKSGKGKASKLFQNQILPMLNDAGIQNFKLIETSHAGHGREIAAQEDFSECSGIVIVSGDGLLYEVIQGMMSRADAEGTIKIPLGILPAGSGNGLCCSINFAAGEPFKSNMLIHSTYRLIKHTVPRPLHLVELDTTADGKVYSFLSVSWGLIADVDIESERFRALGNNRFVLEAVLRIIKPKSYSAKLSFLPTPSYNTKEGKAPQPELVVADQPTNSKPQPNGLNTTDIPQFDMPPLDNPVPENWVTYDSEFVTMVASYQTHLGPETHLAPESSFNDHYIWLFIVRHPMSRLQILNLMGEMETGAHVDNPGVELLPVYAFRLEPTTENVNLVVDGEKIGYGPIQGRMKTDLARLMA